MLMGLAKLVTGSGFPRPGLVRGMRVSFGAMAQLVAHLLCKQGVTGSSPVSSTPIVGLLRIWAVSSLSYFPCFSADWFFILNEHLNFQAALQLIRNITRFLIFL